MFLWKCQSLWDRKCLDLKGTRTPKLRIHAECSNHLSYQGQIFAVPCFFNTGSGGTYIYIYVYIYMYITYIHVFTRSCSSQCHDKSQYFPATNVYQFTLTRFFSIGGYPRFCTYINITGLRVSIHFINHGLSLSPTTTFATMQNVDTIRSEDVINKLRKSKRVPSMAFSMYIRLLPVLMISKYVTWYILYSSGVIVIKTTANFQ